MRTPTASPLSWRPIGRSVALMLACCSSAATWAGEREIHMAPFADQELVYESGVGTVISRARYSVALQVNPIDRRTAWLNVSIFNATDRAVTVAESAIDATSGSGAVTLLRAADLIKKDKRRQFWENVGTGFAAGANSYAAAQSGSYSQSGTFNGRVNTVGSSGYSSSTVHGTYQAYGKDPVASQLAIARANAQNQELINNVRSEQVARSQDLASALFRTETIEPGTSDGGSLQVVLPKAVRGQAQMFEVAVTVDGERHPFVVYVDGAPPQEALQKLASLTALPHPPVVDAVVRAADMVEKSFDDPKRQDRVGLFDIAWTISRPFGRGPIAGTLHFQNPNGESVQLPWVIPAEQAAAERYFQEDTEIPLFIGNPDSDWLLTQIVSGTPLTLRFEPQ